MWSIFAAKAMPISNIDDPGKVPYVTGFVKIDPNHTGTEIHFIAEH